MAMLNNQRANGMIFRCFEHCSYGNSVTEVALSSNPIWRDRRGQRVELEKGGALDGGVIVHQLKMGIYPLVNILKSILLDYIIIYYLSLCFIILTVRSWK